MGNKTVEFRKRAFAEGVKFVVVYASSPVSRIVGIFKIAEVSKGRPTTIWRKFRSVGGISRDDYYRYYATSEHAYGIVIKSVVAFSFKLALDDVRSGMKAPQSFCYLTEKELLSVAEKGAGLPV